MRVRVQKWGNSLAVRIPDTLATTAGSEPGAEVELTLEAGRLWVTPSAPPYTRAGLLGRITPENLHHEIGSGSPLGAEVW
jgi:antitoxin MazE